MAKIRIMQLTRGQRDRMVEVMETRPGNSFWTAPVVGVRCDQHPRGRRVRFCPCSRFQVHSEIVSIGLSTHEDPLSELVDAMRRRSSTDYSDFEKDT